MLPRIELSSALQEYVKFNPIVSCGVQNLTWIGNGSKRCSGTIQHQPIFINIPIRFYVCGHALFVAVMSDTDGCARFSLVQGVGNIIFPPYSETFGRKGLYVISTAVFSAFCVVIAAVPSPAASVVGRAITGFASAIPNVVITGSIEDMFNSRDRIWLVFAYYAIADFGVAMGPVTSMHITTRYGWYAFQTPPPPFGIC